MEEKTYDAAVVGASIAGCTAAILLAREGASVALIERHNDPDAYKALCTHFIQPSAVPTMERLGLLPLIQEAGAVPNEIDLWTRWGWIRTPGGVPHGYNIRRETLDPMLRRLATETPGVDFMPGKSANLLLREGGNGTGRVSGVAIRDRTGNTQDIYARLVVGADGCDSKVAELGGAVPKTKPNNRFIYFAHYRNLHTVSGKRSQMWLLEPDTAYTFPNDDGVTLLTCLPGRSCPPSRRISKEALLASSKTCRKDRNSPARSASRRSWAPPTSSTARARPPWTVSPSSVTRRSGRTPCGVSAAVGLSSQQNGSRTRPPMLSQTAASKTSTGRSPATARSIVGSSPATIASSPTSPQQAPTTPSRGSCSRRRQGTSEPPGTSTPSAPGLSEFASSWPRGQSPTPCWSMRDTSSAGAATAGTTSFPRR